MGERQAEEERQTVGGRDRQRYGGQTDREMGRDRQSGKRQTYRQRERGERERGRTCEESLHDVRL